METKKCNDCGTEQGLSNFSKKGDGLRHICKVCARAFRKRNYQKNKEAIKKRLAVTNKLLQQRNARYLRTLKDVPCLDCKQKFSPYAMQFDHVRGEKEFNISKATRFSRERLEAEMKKCEIVCANCHAVRTHNRRNKVV